MGILAALRTLYQMVVAALVTVASIIVDAMIAEIKRSIVIRVA